MIISASRRTDIPAYYSEWFFNRLRAGYCEAQNPFNPSQVSRIALTREDVDAIVFWSKNPAPMVPRLRELDDTGYRYYFHFTLNDYPKELEAHLPPLEERVETFIGLSRLLGARRVVWRYDPVIISGRTDFRWHRERFAALQRSCAAACPEGSEALAKLDIAYRRLQDLLRNREDDASAQQFLMLAAETYEQGLRSAEGALNISRVLVTINRRDLERLRTKCQTDLRKLEESDGEITPDEEPKAEELKRRIADYGKSLALFEEQLQLRDELLLQCQMLEGELERAAMHLAASGDVTILLQKQGGKSNLERQIDAARAVEAKLRNTDKEQRAEDRFYEKLGSKES